MVFMKLIFMVTSYSEARYFVTNRKRNSYSQIAWILQKMT